MSLAFCSCGGGYIIGTIFAKISSGRRPNDLFCECFTASRKVVIAGFVRTCASRLAAIWYTLTRAAFGLLLKIEKFAGCEGKLSALIRRSCWNLEAATSIPKGLPFQSRYPNG